MSALNVAGNAQYTSEHIVQELVGILAQQIEHAQLQVLSNSRFYGLMIDESTDISVLKQLVLHGRYVSEAGQPCSTLLRIVDLVDGTAERIEEAIKAYLAEKGLSFSKLMGFGSDGASVMTGRVSGVATRLHNSNQYLVAVHCVAHRLLALACSQAGQNVPYGQKFKKSITTLFWFFQASAVQTAGLKAIQELLDSPTLKLKEAKNVRCLSHDQAVQTLRRTLPAVLVALEREGTEKGEPVALGLVKVMKNYQFVACLNLMCEVLPHISHLSRLFQAQYVRLTMIKPSLDACSKTIESYKEMVRTPDIAATESALANQLQQFSIQASPAQKEAFNKNVRQPFLQLLLQNLSDHFPQVELLSAFSVFDPILLCSCDGERESLSLEKLEILLSYYGTGDDAPVNREEVLKEWESFSVMLADHYTRVKTEEVLHDLASEKLKDIYPQLACLASLCLTIPLSTADCERAFSSMKRVKTPLRNRLKTSTLDSLLRISIEGPDLEDFNFDQALSTWTSIRNRRISV